MIQGIRIALAYTFPSLFVVFYLFRLYHNSVVFVPLILVFLYGGQWAHLGLRYIHGDVGRPGAVILYLVAAALFSLNLIGPHESIAIGLWCVASLQFVSEVQVRCLSRAEPTSDATTWQIVGGLAGCGLGTIVITQGIAWDWIVVASYVLLLGTTIPGPRVHSSIFFREAMRDAWQAQLNKNSYLRTLLQYFSVFSFLGSIQITAIILIAMYDWHVNALGLAALYAANGISSIIGALVISRWPIKASPVRAYVGFSVSGVGAALAALSPNEPFGIAALVVAAFALSCGQYFSTQALGRSIPDQVLQFVALLMSFPLLLGPIAVMALVSGFNSPVRVAGFLEGVLFAVVAYGWLRSTVKAQESSKERVVL